MATERLSLDQARRIALAAQGFADVSYERLSLGIVAIHVARKPVAPA